MELGGHAPVIVCEDTKAEKAAISSAILKYRIAGKVCTSPTRFFLHESIYQPFVDSFVQRAKATVVGNGADSGVEMGSLANDRRVLALSTLVEGARDKEAEVLTGGARHGNKGYFILPTVLANMPDNVNVMQKNPLARLP